MSHRALQLSMRRFAARQPTSALAVSRIVSPTLSLTHARQTSDVANPKAAPVASSDSMQILINQRLHRPVSPHLAIYKPQLTWTLSILNRITGSILSGGFYIFGAAYLAAPLFGWQLSSAALAAGFAKWPVFLKVFAKIGVSWPFWFHSFNGVRHLIWDMGKQMTNQQVVTTGWVVLGLTTAGSVATAFI